MRVSEAARFKALRSRMHRLGAQNEAAMLKAATGREVNAPSDDPFAQRMDQRFEALRQRLDGAKEASDQWSSYFESADYALRDGAEVLIQAREHLVAASNGIASPEMRSHIAKEMEGLVASMSSIANAKGVFGHVFNGVHDTQRGASATAWTGNAAVRNQEIFEGVNVEQIDGATIFGGRGGGEDIIALLESARVALEADDGAAIEDALGRLEQADSQIRAGFTAVKRQTDAIERFEGFRDSMDISGARRQNELVGADIAEVVSELSMSKVALEAVAQISSQVNGLNVLRQL